MKREIVDCDSTNKLNGYRENADLKANFQLIIVYPR